jgi:hypothetical protein
LAGRNRRKSQHTRPIGSLKPDWQGLVYVASKHVLGKKHPSLLYTPHMRLLATCKKNEVVNIVKWFKISLRYILENWNLKKEIKHHIL